MPLGCSATAKVGAPKVTRWLDPSTRPSTNTIDVAEGATRLGAADALGQKGKVGTIAPQAYADIIAVTGNPLADISLLEDVSFVMKGGEIYKSE